MTSKKYECEDSPLIYIENLLYSVHIIVSKFQGLGSVLGQSNINEMGVIPF
jgi:hypothetical protein